MNEYALYGSKAMLPAVFSKRQITRPASGTVLRVLNNGSFYEIAVEGVESFPDAIGSRFKSSQVQVIAVLYLF